MKYYIRIVFVTLFLFFSFSEINGQVCTGSLGNPVVFIDFGRGNETFGPPLSSTNTNYNYVTGAPNDGNYTIANTTAGMYNTTSGWHQILNHSDDGGGYMMIVNCSNTPGVFYQTTVNNLCPNTTYEFASWLINLLNYSGNKPNVTFEILDIHGNLLSTPYTTGNIPETTTPIWKQYGLTFKTPANVSSVILKMTNNAAGGTGNDIAIDDITFRPCGPSIITSVNNTSISADLCEGYDWDYNLTAILSNGYLDPVYQWQILENNNWVDLPGFNKIPAIINFKTFPSGIYKYRLIVAERINGGSIGCSVISPVITFNVEEYLNPIASSNSNSSCVGSDINLSVDKGTTYLWTGPNGFTSTLKNPTLKNVTEKDAGIYTVQIYTKSLCSSFAQTQVNVLPAIVANTNISDATICQNESISLEATGGNKYTWLPTDGLSNPNISNPIASPKQTTKYTVKIANGDCFVNKEITINVLESAEANASADKKIVAGQSVILKGIANGLNVKYLWSPSTYLDDPTKLSPVATPKEDITYRLTVESDCGTSIDDVFIKVFSKVEIPSAFTPNNDGINDVWEIPAIAVFEYPKLKVVDRKGQLVYQSNGTKPWDGKFKGKDLPTGVYYYTLYLNEDFKTYSGWVLLSR